MLAAVSVRGVKEGLKCERGVKMNAGERGEAPHPPLRGTFSTYVEKENQATTKLG